MKRYNLTIQERNDYCFCSALQAIFRKKGLELTQEQIASELFPLKNGFSIDGSKIKGFMSDNGFEYECFYHNATPLNEPDFLLNEMNVNHGIIGIDKHAFLLTDFKDPKIRLIDPVNGETITKNYYEMLREMQKSVGIFGLIKYVGINAW